MKYLNYSITINRRAPVTCTIMSNKFMKVPFEDSLRIAGRIQKGLFHTCPADSRPEYRRRGKRCRIPSSLECKNRRGPLSRICSSP